MGGRLGEGLGAGGQRPHSRGLTPGEMALVQSQFGEAVDTSRVRIHARKWFPFQPRETVMAPDGHLWFHPESSLWCADFAAAPLSLQGLFIHEMTHVWQSQRGGRWFLPLVRHPFCRYAYRFAPERPFRRYGVEQQAEMVRHAFLLERGVILADRPALSAYRAILPFPAGAASVPGTDRFA